MGFYGNISNTAKSSFQFDRIYSSRTAMENLDYNDGVYVGRYVLVEYDKALSQLDYKEVYRSSTDTNVKFLYTSVNCEESTKIRYTENTAINPDDIIYGVTEGTLVFVDEATVLNPGQKGGPFTYYVCNGYDGQFATFEEIEDDNTYAQNYHMDRISFPDSKRGYDSTVWQKTFVNGAEKYVMVAELNTVVPTFDITADAPSTTPITPHFDERSTDVYYKLHWQPQWGFRIAAGGEKQLFTPVLDKNGDPTTIYLKDPVSGVRSSITETRTTEDDLYFPSDATTIWERREYDADTGEEKTTYYDANIQQWLTQPGEKPEVPAAIYWNAAGFNPDEIHYSADLLNSNEDEYNKDYQPYLEGYWTDEDKITILPSGRSGHTYETHGAERERGPVNVYPDTQELSVMLPSIGNSIAQLWDIVYGGRATSDKIKFTNKRNKTIAWEDAGEGVKREGLRLLHPQYVQVTFNSEEEFAQSTNTYYFQDQDTGEYVIADAYDPAMTYYTTTGGLTMDHAEVATLAGAINSVYDLMGMIVVEQDMSVSPDNLNAEDLDDNLIYYFAIDGTFRHKVETNTYTDIEYKYLIADEVNERTYKPNIYYIQTENGKFEPDLYLTFEAERAQIDQWLEESLATLLRQFENEEISEDEYNYQCELKRQEAERLKTEDYADIGSGLYDPDAIYIKKVSDFEKNEEYQLANVGAFMRGSYYRTQEGNYMYDDSSYPQTNLRYYELLTKIEDLTAVNMNTSYAQNTYFFLDEDGNYVVDTENNATLGRHYFSINTDLTGRRIINIPLADVNNYDPLNGYFTSIPTLGEDEEGNGVWEWGDQAYYELEYFYTPNTFYYHPKDEDGNDIEDTWVLEDAQAFTAGRQYYILDQEPGNSVIVDGVEVEGYEVRNAYRVNLTMLDTADNYYYYDGTTGAYRKLTNVYLADVQKNLGLRPDKSGQINIIAEEYYALSPIAHGYLYEPGMFFTLNGKSFILCNDAQPDIDELYYSLADVKFRWINQEFYVPNKYYYWNEHLGVWILAKGLFNENITYYNKIDFYVKDDTLGVFARGSVWNREVTTIPCTVTLAKISKGYQLDTLVGFGRDTNTLHGLILQVNKMLRLSDYETRDRATIQGTINTMNDLINKFDTIVPREFVIVDDYGRIKSSSWTSLQADLIHNEQDNIVDVEVPAEEDRWFHIEMNSDSVSPMIYFEHNAHSVDNTFTTSDKNAPEVIDEDEDLIAGNNNNKGDTLVLYTPITDATGHIVGKNTEEVTLPYGFKTITVAEQSTLETPMEPNDNTIVAEMTQDTLGLATDNKWINIAADSDNDVLHFAHSAPDFEAGSADTEYGLTKDIPDPNSYETVGESNLKNTFPVPVFKFDEAGHIISADTHRVTLPAGFQQIEVTVETDNETESTSGTAGVIDSDSIIDKLTISEGNQWINIHADADKKEITIEHYITEIPTETGSIELDTSKEGGVNQFEIPNYEYDNAGHVTKKVTRTVAVPYSYGKMKLGDKTAAATSTNSTFEFAVAEDDKWINLELSTDDSGKLIINHQEPVEVTAATPAEFNGQFGGSFPIDYWVFDERGHKSGNAVTKTITLPTPSLIPTSKDNNAGKILTNLTLTPTTGAFEYEYQNVGTLKLTGFTTPTEAKKETILSSDTLNTALAKLEASISSTEANIGGLKLANYSKTYLNDSDETVKYTGQVTSADTINTAFAKLSNDIATLNGSKDTVGSVAHTAALQIAEVVAGADAKYDTLNEIATWIMSDTTGAAKMANDISTLQNHATAIDERAQAIEDRTAALEKTAVPAHDTLDNNQVYMLHKDGEGNLEWVALKQWTGGSY